MNKNKFKKILYLDIAILFFGMIKVIFYPYSFAPNELAKAITLYEEILPIPDAFSLIILVIAFLSLFPAYYYLFKFQKRGIYFYIFSTFVFALSVLVNGYYLFDSLEYIMAFIDILISGFIISIVYFSNLTKSFR